MLNLDASSGALPMCTCAFPGMNATWFDVPSCRGPKGVTRSVLYLVAKNKSTVYVRCSKDIEWRFLLFVGVLPFFTQVFFALRCCSNHSTLTSFLSREACGFCQSL